MSLWQVVWSIYYYFKKYRAVLWLVEIVYAVDGPNFPLHSTDISAIRIWIWYSQKYFYRVNAGLSGHPPKTSRNPSRRVSRSVINKHFLKKTLLFEKRWFLKGFHIIHHWQTIPPVDLYLISEKSIWKNQVWRNGFLVYFEHDFYCLCSLQKSISKWIFAD